MYGLAVHPAPPLFTSLTKATVGVASQLSASSFTTVISGAGTSAMHCTFTGVGLLAVGLVLSTAVIVCVTLMLFPQSSVTLYVLVTMYGLAVHPAPPLFKSLTKATVGVASQLSASSFTTVISGTGTSAMHCTFTGAGLLAVGLVLSTAVIVCVTLMLFPQSSVTLYVLVTMYGLAVHPAPPLFTSLTKATVGVASQLSASSFTTVISGTGTSAMHCTFTGAGLDAVGLVLSTAVMVCATLMLLPQSSVTL